MKYQQAPLSYIKKYYEADVEETKTPESRFYQKYLRKVKGDKVLSVACGPQFYNDLQFFGRKPKEYIGLDINRNTIRFLTTSKNYSLLASKKKAKDIKTKVLVGDILRHNPEFRGEFDCVIALAVLGMFKQNDFRKAVRNIRSYLKPGGTFLDIDWTDADLSRKTYLEKVKYRFWTNQGPSIQEQGSLIKSVGFKIVQYDQYSPDKKTYQWGKIFVYLAKRGVSTSKSQRL